MRAWPSLLYRPGPHANRTESNRVNFRVGKREAGWGVGGGECRGAEMQDYNLSGGGVPVPSVHVSGVGGGEVGGGDAGCSDLDRLFRHT